MLTTISAERIQQVFTSYRHAEQTIALGSDEHLDMMLKVQKDLKHLTQLTEELANEVEACFNEQTKESAQVLVDELTPLLKLADSIIESLKNSFLRDSIADGLEAFVWEVSEIQESVDDLIQFRISPPVWLQSFCDDLKRAL